MNFDMAAETGGRRRHRDAHRAGLGRRGRRAARAQTDRRGIAGDLFVIKIAGAAAATLPTLDEVYDVTAKARDNTRSMGVALAPGSIPETGRAHLRAGRRRDRDRHGPARRAGRGARQDAARRRPGRADDGRACSPTCRSGPATRSACWSTTSGATTWMELLIVTRQAAPAAWPAAGIAVHDTMVGQLLHLPGDGRLLDHA